MLLAMNDLNLIELAYWFLKPLHVGMIPKLGWIILLLPMLALEPDIVYWYVKPFFYNNLIEGTYLFLNLLTFRSRISIRTSLRKVLFHS